MTDRADASRAMHAEPNVAVVRELWLAGVHPYPDAYIGAFGPRLVVVRTLNRDRSRDGVLRSAEGEEEALALGVHLPSAILLDGVSHELPVSREKTGVIVPSRLRRRVEPSMSVKTKVTVPTGSSLMEAPIVAPGGVRCTP